MSELIEFDLNNEKIKSPAQDEFFDAEDKGKNIFLTYLNIKCH